VALKRPGLAPLEGLLTEAVLKHACVAPEPPPVTPEPTFSWHWPTKNMLCQVVEGGWHRHHLTAGPQELSSAPASFRLKLRPFTSVSLRMVFPPAGG
jgi:hypothetical protein